MQLTLANVYEATIPELRSQLYALLEAQPADPTAFLELIHTVRIRVLCALEQADVLAEAVSGSGEYDEFSGNPELKRILEGRPDFSQMSTQLFMPIVMGWRKELYVAAVLSQFEGATGGVVSNVLKDYFTLSTKSSLTDSCPLHRLHFAYTESEPEDLELLRRGWELASAQLASMKNREDLEWQFQSLELDRPVLRNLTKKQSETPAPEITSVEAAQPSPAREPSASPAPPQATQQRAPSPPLAAYDFSYSDSSQPSQSQSQIFSGVVIPIRNKVKEAADQAQAKLLANKVKIEAPAKTRKKVVPSKSLSGKSLSPPAKAPTSTVLPQISPAPAPVEVSPSQSNKTKNMKDTSAILSVEPPPPQRSGNSNSSTRISTRNKSVPLLSPAPQLSVTEKSPPFTTYPNDNPAPAEGPPSKPNEANTTQNTSANSGPGLPPLQRSTEFPGPKVYTRKKIIPPPSPASKRPPTATSRPSTFPPNNIPATAEEAPSQFDEGNTTKNTSATSSLEPPPPGQRPKDPPLDDSLESLEEATDYLMQDDYSSSNYVPQPTLDPPTAAQRSNGAASTDGTLTQEEYKGALEGLTQEDTTFDHLMSDGDREEEEESDSEGDSLDGKVLLSGLSNMVGEEVDDESEVRGFADETDRDVSML
ncbi:hypothetical protein P7C70_g2457, partial [Phenoliferia sp. Uapishka_3]